MSMRAIEELTDAEIAQADQSAGLFGEILEMTAPLDAFLSLVHAFDWLNVRDTDGRTALQWYMQSAFGDPVRIANGEVEGDARLAGSRALRPDPRRSSPDGSRGTVLQLATGLSERLD